MFLKYSHIPTFPHSRIAALYHCTIAAFIIKEKENIFLELCCKTSLLMNQGISRFAIKF
jgi:hypothetical protein